MCAILRGSNHDTGQRVRRDIYVNISSAYHLGRALSAVFGGLSGTVVARYRNGWSEFELRLPISARAQELSAAHP